jgi:ATP synthase A1 C subunit
MNEYDYLNARVRGMSTELLQRDFYEQILALDVGNPLTDALLGSPYAPRLKEALAVLEGMDAVESALRRNLFDTFSRVRSCAPPEPRRLLNVQFNQWDAENILSILRGKVTGADSEEIMEGVLPAGEFDEPQLQELAAEPDVAAVADALTTWNYRFAFALRRAIREIEDPTNLVELESAVNGIYFHWALSELNDGDVNVRLARRMISMQIDLANVREALDHVRHRVGGKPIERVEFLPGGLLEYRKILQISEADSMVEAFEHLAETYYEPGIEKGILAFGEAENLGVMERFMEQVVIEEGCSLFRRDPLSISVPLGFIWRKYNEFLNLRILVRGKAYRMPANAIREEMLIE